MIESRPNAQNGQQAESFNVAILYVKESVKL